MKFFTKEWYSMMQLCGLGNGFEKIPDREYTDEDILNFYNKALKREIAFEEEEYNRPPELWLPDDLDDEDFDVTEYDFEDDDGNEIIPESAEEVRQLFIKEYKQECEAFANREPFDPSEVESCFEEIYRNSLRENCRLHPKWMAESVDPRLIALNLLPETAYNRFEEELWKAEKEFERIGQAYDEISSKQQIPEDIEELFDLHDACLFLLKQEAESIVMVFRKNDVLSEDEGEYRKLIFKNAKILEQDQNINTRKLCNEYGEWTETFFLYSELYHSEIGYEIHLLFAVGDDLAYLTLECSDVMGMDESAC